MILDLISFFWSLIYAAFSGPLDILTDIIDVFGSLGLIVISWLEGGANIVKYFTPSFVSMLLIPLVFLLELSLIGLQLFLSVFRFIKVYVPVA